MTHKNDSDVCCPQFDPKPWDNQTHIWENKLFIKDTMPVFFHIPFPWKIEKIMTKMWKMAQDSGAAPEIKDFLVLVTDTSPWRSEYYMYVLKEVPGIENVRFTGMYISKVFDGPYNSVPKYIKETESYVNSLGKKVKTYYFYYTTCPKCAKKIGHNYIVAFAEVLKQ